MDILAWVVGLIAAAGFGMAGIAKITKQEAMVQAAGHLGFAPSQFQMIGAAELAGAVGIVIGLVGSSDFTQLIGQLAGIGLALVGAGAVFTHNRAGDAPKDMAPAGVLGLLSAVFVVAFSLA